jgi:hypothetical protein
MSDSPTDPMATSAEAKETLPPDISSFDYPPLDRSKAHFSVLYLEPGSSSEKIEATIETHCLPELSHIYNPELHLSELTAIHDRLSIATTTGAEVSLEELLCWERLYSKLNELYLLALFRNIPMDNEVYSTPLTNDLERLIEMRELFVVQVKQHQSISCNPCEVNAMQALINSLESILPNRKLASEWTVLPS